MGRADGLVLRWATAADVDAVASFNAVIHGQRPDQPATEVALWTKDLMRGDHPVVTPADFTVVVDPAAGDKIVSSCVLLSQTWSYDGIEFGVGQPELVGTDPAYRRRGLIRDQMDTLHALSAARGELIQGITGIPWYYRQFGYEMTVSLSGARLFVWQRDSNLQTKPTGQYTARPVTAADIPFLQQLYARASGESFLQLVRTDVLWRYAIFGPQPGSVQQRAYRLVAREDGQPFGYFSFAVRNNRYEISEIAVAPGCSLRELALFVLHHLRAEAAAQPTGETLRDNPVMFRFGESHPVYQALDEQLERLDEPYAWYIRVPDLAGFLRHIAPALEQKLAVSVLAGHTGTLKLNLIHTFLLLRFEQGRLVAVEPYQPENYWDGDVYLPDLTVYHLLFRHRTLAELNTVRRDCWCSRTEAAILLNALFPKQPALVFGFV